MVDSEAVKKRKRMLKPLYPPAVTVFSHIFPVKNRISPKLTLAAEAVGRHSRNSQRIKISVKLKLSGVSPDICAVMRNIYRQIADNINSVFVGIGFQRIPLTEK